MKCTDPECLCHQEPEQVCPGAGRKDTANQNSAVIQFGPFVLDQAGRILEREGSAVRLAGRAMDLLIALVESAGSVVGKRELIARVWPDTIVEEGSLRFHILAVRKALSDGENGTRFVVNVPGRGYTFVAPVSHAPVTTARPESAPATRVALQQRQSLSAYGPVTIIGRDRELASLADRVFATRFVSVIGPGGMGKTSVVAEVARRLSVSFSDKVTFIDFSVLTDPSMVAPTVAAMLGVSSLADGVQLLLDKEPFLLVLDCCEHLVEAVALVAEQLVAQMSCAHLLVTSREALRARGEFVYRLSPLATPPADANLGLEEALQWPAIRLFVERAEASGAPVAISDEDLPEVARLCRELGGNALAIELVAGQIETFGLTGLVEQLDQHSRLLWEGRRTAVIRHQTLNATLSWSYDLLGEVEQAVLNRLAVFTGVFTLEAACAVAAGEAIAVDAVILALRKLVSKSLVNIDAGGEVPYYSLLDTTRLYASQKLRAAEEFAAISKRHARWVIGALADGRPGGSASTVELGNARAALRWALMEGNDTDAGCALAARIAPYFLAGSLIGECRKWAELALTHLPERLVGSAEECDLHAALGQSKMFVEGNSPEVGQSFARAATIAAKLDDRRRQFQLVSVQTLLLQRTGACREAYECAAGAHRFLSADDPQDVVNAASIMGPALHMVGRLSDAKRCWTTVLAKGTGMANALGATDQGYDPVLKARCGQVASLWLDGHEDLAAEVADELMAQARALNHHPTFCIVAIWTGLVFAWRGEWKAVKRNAAEILIRARACNMTPYVQVARMLEGLALGNDGDVDAGIALLKETLRGLRSCHYEMLVGTCEIGLANAFIAKGQFEAALTIADDALEGIDRRGDEIHRVDALTAKANALMGCSVLNVNAASSLLSKAREVALAQGAPAWLLRTDRLLERLLKLRRESDRPIRRVTAIDAATASGSAPEPHEAMLQNEAWQRWQSSGAFSSARKDA
ncbi:putative ATPase/DNA-binding winged helix-turn-helix (wHTH) protein/tetratricopeptide (TPR) repeat protein [Variovorax boronicumulans]|uniref:ATP-binding protein n=1 Tax=Variovorax boronicumulans TaxID=436515 RepID=UPI002785A730|nr:winged helix-turn-helix domain-containing protein [Variovorax boronicumulans]MDP9995252.1 putative ATPase/DNA-binding winged helix-turn-helix (wHTH) protein/tetratricopeptide (TPR) repeat protein [Variovorax boronicumulans]MDQ0006542.1 putative ATPase/DNA-binding winged helix-turn-helix (wHTH) protein/tetratricopeptide (TPR) repeat protein [Variovorax boronicumulans]